MCRSKPVRKRQSTLVRQTQIVDAARKLIIKYGSEHLTARRIAKEIGVSEGAIYRHFKSKRDILFLMVDHIEHNLIAEIDPVCAAGTTPLKILDGSLRKQISSIEQRKGISFQVIAEIISLGDKKLNKKAYEVINKYTARIQEMLSEGVKAGEIRKDMDLDAAATLIFSIIQGLVNIWALNDYGFNLEERYVSAWNILREAVVNKAPSPLPVSALKGTLSIKGAS